MTDSKTAPLSLKANTLWNSVGSFFYLVCQWLTTVLVVTFSDGFDNSGILAFAMAIGLVQAAVGNYGIRPFQVSDIENEYSSKEYIGFRLITNGVAFVICAIYLMFLAIDSASIALVIACLIYLIFKFNESFSDVLYGIFQKSSRMDYIGKAQIIKGIVSLCAFAVPLFLTKNIIAAIACMTVLCFAVTFIYELPRTRLFGPVKPAIERTASLNLAKACAASMVASTLLVLVVSAVRQYFGIAEGETPLGIYAAIATPAVVVQAALNYLYMPFIGELSSKYRCGHKAFFKEFCKVLVILLVAFILLVAVLSLIGPPFLLLVFGESISEYLYIFVYVLCATAMVGIISFFYNALVVVRKSGWMLALSAAAFVASLISSIPLIKAFYMNGINLAVIFGCSVGIAIGIVGVLSIKDKHKGSAEVDTGMIESTDA